MVDDKRTELYYGRTSWKVNAVAIALLLSIGMLHAGVWKKIDVGLAWSATRTGHPCVDTFNDQQAVSYFNKDHCLTVSQRHVNGEKWAHFVTGVKGSLDDGGGHMMTAVAIDKAGYTHVMGAMHNKPLKYWRSVVPVEVRPDGTCADKPLVMERVPKMVDTDERLTYPMFFRDASEDLYLIYRHGGSGNGDTIINKLEATTQTWKRMPTLFKRPGSVYNRRPILGDDGNIHLLFMWRGSPKGHTGNTLGYIKSKDMINWTTAEGEPVSLPLRQNHKVAVVDPSPQRGGLLNVSYSLGFDSSGRPVVAYNKFVDDKREAGSGLYVARYEEGKWNRLLIDSEPSEKDFTSYYRPVDPVVGGKGIIHLAYFLMPRAGRGRLSSSGSSRMYVLNEKDLSVKEVINPSPMYWPDTVYKTEIAPTKLVKDLTVEMRPWDTSHSAFGFPSGNPDTGCFLRWEYGKSGRLKKPELKDLPSAGMLRLYEVDRKLLPPDPNMIQSAPKMKPKQTTRPAIVFLVGGQSNAGGCGVISAERHKELGHHKKRPLLPGSTAPEAGLSVDAADYTHSYMWVPEKGFQRTDPGVNTRPMELNGNWHGMELPVLRELENRFPENDVFVVKYGPGSTTLHTDWNPERQDAKRPCYTTWLGYYRTAMAQLVKEYPEVRVVGLYWDQGESDGCDGQHKAYETNLKKFIATVRRDTGLPELNVFVRKHIFDWPNIETVIAAQKAGAAADPGVHLLDIDLGDRKKNYRSWAYSPGNGHVSSKGFVALTGKLFDGPLKDATLASFAKYSKGPTKSIKPPMSADLLAKISLDNVKHLRNPVKQKTPDWARKVFEERIRVLKERIEKNYKETGRWYYVKYEESDCGGSVWWDEVATFRVYVTLQGFVGGIEKLPHYSPENHRKAVEFWQSWQNEQNGLFYNPFFVDPENPRSQRKTEGYNPEMYHRRGKDIEKVTQKYPPLVLGGLGSAPLYQVEEERRLADENIGAAVGGIEKSLKKGARGQAIGNQVTRQLWLMADHIDRGRTELIPDYERMMALLLRRFHTGTGLLGKPNFADYVTSANNVKCNARIIGYIGLENYPHRRKLADSLAGAFTKKGVKHSGAIRNWSYLSTLVLQQTDHRRDDLYTAIENLVKGFEKGGGAGYCWMSLSTAAAWLHWDFAEVGAFDDPSVNLCYNGVNRPYRSVVGPFGRWVNVIPREPDETYGAPGSSWDKHGLRARNALHEKRTITDIVPATAEAWEKSTDEKGHVILRRSFVLGDDKRAHPYLKARWNGSMELYLNGVLVKKVSDSVSDYCGLYIPKAAEKALKKGENVLMAKALTPKNQITLDAGVIDWSLQADKEVK